MKPQESPLVVAKQGLPARVPTERDADSQWAVVLPSQPSPSLPDTDYRSTVRLGLAILVLGFGGLVAWALLAPLDEGIPAKGTLEVESSRKRIDHLNGGLIEKILVRDGQLVQEGEELIVLNEIQSKSALNATLNQWHVAMATMARLRAERTGSAAISFPADLVSAAAKDPEAALVMRSQGELFRARQNALQGELTILAESVRGLELQLESLAQLKAGRETQVALFEEQLASYRKLRGEGFVSRNQLLELERQLAEVQSKQSEDLSNIAGISARLSGFRMRGAQRAFEYRSEVETQLAEVQREFANLGERRAAQRDTLSRLVVRAPVTGVVVDLAVHTVGGVVKPGDRIMDILPQGDALVLEAKVAPQYVDRLRPGLPADIHFDAYSIGADRPVIKGEVVVVSADALVDARSGVEYYSMRVKISPQEAKRLGELRLQAGMQATVMVKTGERSFFVYLTGPLLRRFATAMREH